MADAVADSVDSPVNDPVLDRKSVSESVAVFEMDALVVFVGEYRVAVIVRDSLCSFVLDMVIVGDFVKDEVTVADCSRESDRVMVAVFDGPLRDCVRVIEASVVMDLDTVFDVVID